jgi:hypothetical protein
VAFIEARMGGNKNDKPAVFVEDNAPVDEIDEDIDGADDDEEDDDDEDETPCVVLGRLSDLKGFGDPGLLRKHGDRPVWFMIENDADFMTLFDKHRERRVAPELSRSVMDVLRSFAAYESDKLQYVLGATDRIEFGFHEGASFDDVLEAFEDDGFDVAIVLKDGKVVDSVDDKD